MKPLTERWLNAINAERWRKRPRGRFVNDQWIEVQNA